jgi:hypothetical protein
MKELIYTPDKIFFLLDEFQKKTGTSANFFKEHKIGDSTFYRLRSEYGSMTVKQIEKMSKLVVSNSKLKSENELLLKKCNAATVFIKKEFSSEKVRRNFALSIVQSEDVGPKSTCEIFSIKHNSLCHNNRKKEGKKLILKWYRDLTKKELVFYFCFESDVGFERFLDSVKQKKYIEIDDKTVKSIFLKLYDANRDLRDEERAQLLFANLKKKKTSFDCERFLEYVRKNTDTKIDDNITAKVYFNNQ